MAQFREMKSRRLSRSRYIPKRKVCSFCRDKVKDILAAKGEDIFEVSEPKESLPKRARVFKSIECSRCGESAMETRIHIFKDRFLCTPCYEETILE